MRMILLAMKSYSKMYKNAGCWLAFLLLCRVLPAQGGLTVFNTANSGLPDNAVNALALAPDGALWAGTDFGLARFDGSNWTVYQAGSSGLPGNSVRSVAVDDSGAVWAGTFTGGLARLHGGTWTTWNTSNSGLPGDHVRSLGVDSVSGMWVGTTNGTARLRNGVWTTWDFIAKGGESNNTAAIAVTGTDSLWIGLVNGGLVRLADTSFVDYTINNSALTDNTILGLVVDGDDPWLATPANGIVYNFNLSFFTYQPFNSDNPSASFTAITLDAGRKVWAASVDSGLVYYDRTNWRRFSMDNSSMPDNYVRAVLHDPVSGYIWAGTRSGGLVRIEPQVLADDDPVAGLGYSLFPQPCAGQVTLRAGSKPGILTLTDLQGRPVWTGRYNGAGEEQLDFGQLAQGMYVLQGTFGGQVWRGRLVIR
jgi:ligand-binding sensor domain-containing protein